MWAPAGTADTVLPATPAVAAHLSCANLTKITGISFDGGYAEYVVIPAEAVASMPDDLPADEAAPLLCASITAFNSLRNSGARAGDLVAVQGIGGMGHLGNTPAKWVFVPSRSDAVETKNPWQTTRRSQLHRRCYQRASGRLASPGRRKCNSRNRTRFKGDLAPGRRAGARRKAGYRGRGPGASCRHAAATYFKSPNGSGLALRYRQRFRRHLAVQLAVGCPPHDRTLPAGESRGSLRSNDQRTSPAPRRPDYGQVNK